jgi:hypothetical protein
LRTRIALASLALGATLASAYGERWMLSESPLPALEYAAVTCAALAVEDEQAPLVCRSNEQDAREE